MSKVVQEQCNRPSAEPLGTAPENPKIREMLALAEALMHGTDDFVTVINSTGEILEVSETVARRLGRDRLSLVGCVASDLFLTQVASRRMAAFERVKESGKSERFEDENEDRYFDNVLYPIQGSDGRVDKVLWIAREITERKRAENELRTARDMLTLIINNVPQGIFWKDLESKYLGCNNIFAEAAGLDSSLSIIGKTDHDLPWYKEQAESFRECDRRIMENDAPEYHIVEQQREADGKMVWVETNKVPLHDSQGKVVGILGTYENITDRKRVEEALRKSEKATRLHLAEIEAIYKSAHVGLCIIDRDFRYVRVNDRLAEMNGLSVEENVGKTIREVVPDFADVAEQLANKIFQTGEPVLNVELSGTTRSQPGIERCWVEHWLPFKDDSGQVIGINVAVNDVTELKRAVGGLRESEERFRSLVETTSDWIWEVDAEGIYTYASPRVLDLLDYEPEEVLGRKPFEFMPQEESARLKAHFSQMIKERKGCIGLENVNIRKDGRHVVLETSCVPRLDERGNFLGYRGIDRDITDRKHAEEVLQRSRDELKRLVQERTAELEKRSQELQDFTFAAAHDLQEPLRKIQTFTDLLAGHFDLESEQGRDYFKRMHKTATRMRDVLQSLIRYSLFSKAVRFVQVDLNEIAREAISDLELRIRDAGALVEVGDLPKIEAEPGQMRQLFQNLLGNALKFRREGVQHRIKIHADCNSQEGKCEISVSDNGIGFEERYLDLIFKPFQRLHRRDEYGGVGMGLAICAKVVEHHGGTITAKSIPGQGSTFIVTLPVNPAKS